MSSRGKDKYDHKAFNGSVDARVQESRSESFIKKFPLRVQNDWSEHISSKGLIYYYNCRTEVSQWQKPEEWTLSSMPQEDIKKLLNTKYRNGENNNKRNHTNPSVQDINTSPKRIKYNNNNNNNNNQSIQIDKQINVAKSQKAEQVNTKSVNPLSNAYSGIVNKCKNNEANFNNDDMDISPGSSPLSRGSHSSECDNNNSKKQHYFEFETPAYRNQSSNPSKNVKPFIKSWTVVEQQKDIISSPAAAAANIITSNSNQEITASHQSMKIGHNSQTALRTTINNNNNNNNINSSANNKYPTDNSTGLTQFQISLAVSLRATLNILQSRSQFSYKDDFGVVSNNHAARPVDNCLSVYHISDLLFRLEAVNNNGETANNYRSHRLQTQLSQQSGHNNNNNSLSYSNSNNYNNSGGDSKGQLKPTANITQIKELVKCLQDFIQENYPSSLSMITPVSPNYSKSNRVSYYLQILGNLIETCLMQLCPQSLNSPSSTSSPCSLKDNNSSVSTSGNSQSYGDVISNKPDIDSPTKKEHIEIEKPKSILQDMDMMKYVSSDVTNSYRNQLADYYVQEAQVEYYKFVRLHSVLYAELACESKKLKALVRISEINTELLKQKKEDLEKLVQMLESRRLPNHLKCDYIPNS